MQEKFISVVANGLDEYEEEFVSESLGDMFEILLAFEAKKWEDFEFYCRYGYFEDDRYTSYDDSTKLDEEVF